MWVKNRLSEIKQVAEEQCRQPSFEGDERHRTIANSISLKNVCEDKAEQKCICCRVVALGAEGTQGLSNTFFILIPAMFNHVRECWSLAGELSLSCARPAADG